jgi:hypothetical protein
MGLRDFFPPQIFPSKSPHFGPVVAKIHVRNVVDDYALGFFTRFDNFKMVFQRYNGIFLNLSTRPFFSHFSA